MATIEDTNYTHRGVPLTAAIAQALIRELFSGQLVERRIIADEVVRTHISRGGLKAVAQNLSKIIEKALGDMKRSGEAENTSFGYWRIQQIPPSETDQPIAIEELRQESEHSVSQVTTTPEPAADIELGAGPGAIYVYYLPTYRLRAQERGEKAWPCKIGRTDRDPLSRVLSQAATALPERPRIAIIVRTPHPGAWERALQGVLTLRGLQIEDSPGAEWFLTSPEEIVELVKLFDPTISDGASISDGQVGA